MPVLPKGGWFIPCHFKGIYIIGFVSHTCHHFSSELLTEAQKYFGGEYGIFSVFCGIYYKK
jgi:hypothetical protein